jgi:arylsulfatase A-like enzyme
MSAFTVGKPAKRVRPHVVLFICDQMQYRRQGQIDPVASTPNLDRLADEGVFFTHYHASNGQCVPSRVSMQTGLYPHEAGVMIIYGFHGHTAHLTGEQRTLGHVFRDAGYITAYFGKTHFGTTLPRLGYQHGSEGPAPAGADEGDGPPRPPADRPPRRPAADRVPRRNSRTDRAIVDGALDYLAGYDPSEPLFLTVSIHQPHPPFELVESFADRFPPERLALPRSFPEDDLRGKPPFQREHALDGRHGYAGAGPEDIARLRDELRRYYTMIANVDALFGEVRAALEAKGMWAGSVVAFTSDHGDMMGAHRMRLKGTVPYDEIFRIPFILKLPAGARFARRVVDDLAVNVAQPGTLVEAAGLPVPPEFRGGSLLPALAAGERPAQEAIFYEHYGAYWGLHPFRAVRVRDAAGGEWKLVKYYGPDAGEAELYDLVADPDEIHNRASEPAHAARRAELEARVDDWWWRTGGRDFGHYESPAFKLSGAATLVDGTRRPTAAPVQPGSRVPA